MCYVLCIDFENNFYILSEHLNLLLEVFLAHFVHM